MPRTQQAVLAPRKSPVQARSITSVNAILEATVQVLLEVGKERLTTTRVAHRAGVSVGTLYQYFPNKSALLQAVLRNHLVSIADEIDKVCQEEKGSSVTQMIMRVTGAFLDTKVKNLKTSIALYSVSSDVDGWKIAKEVGNRINKSIASLLATAKEPLSKDGRLVASMVQGAMAGVGRTILESASPEKDYRLLRQELVFMTQVYVEACFSKGAN